MNKTLSIPIVYTLTLISLTATSVHDLGLNINTFILFLYLLMTSFMNYKNIDKENIIHVSWISVCISTAIYLNNFALAMLLIGLVPISLILSCHKKSMMSFYKGIKLSNTLLFILSAILYFVGQLESSLIIAIIAVQIRQSQFPFHIWIREIKQNKVLFPSILFFAVTQSGFIAYSRPNLYMLHHSFLLNTLPVVTLLTGLVLAVYALNEKESLTKHLLIITSQACLPMAAYHSFSTTSATGGILFSMVIALGGLIFGMLGFHFFLQKNISTLNQYYSLYRNNKSLAGIYFVSGFSIVGLPLTLGYFAEDILFHGLVETSPLLTPLYVIMTAVNGFNIFLLVNKIFFGHNLEKWTELYHTKTNKFMIGLGLICITFGGVAIAPLCHTLETKLKDERAQVIVIPPLNSQKGVNSFYQVLHF